MEEHLLFYARLKGVSPKEEASRVSKALKSIAMEPFRTRVTSGLSGGEKRRLSIGIALIGDPEVNITFLSYITKVNYFNF